MGAYLTFEMRDLHWTASASEAGDGPKQYRQPQSKHKRRSSYLLLLFFPGRIQKSFPLPFLLRLHITISVLLIHISVHHQQKILQLATDWSIREDKKTNSAYFKLRRFRIVGNPRWGLTTAHTVPKTPLRISHKQLKGQWNTDRRSKSSNRLKNFTFVKINLWWPHLFPLRREFGF